jgi:hypothetical protein
MYGTGAAEGDVVSKLRRVATLRSDDGDGDGDGDDENGEDVKVEHVDRQMLGQGAFGCVFAPALPCASAPRAAVSRAAVSKVFASEEAWAQEVEANEFVATEVDPDGAFTLRMQAACTVRMDRAAGPLHKCRAFVGSGTRLRKQIVAPQGGSSLHALTVLTAADFWKVVTGCGPIAATGLGALARAGVAHMDIKPDNVLFAQRAVLIDFGIARSFQDAFAAEASAERLESRYLFYPPEYHQWGHALLGGPAPDHASVLHYVSSQAYRLVEDGHGGVDSVQLSAAFKVAHVLDVQAWVQETSQFLADLQETVFADPRLFVKLVANKLDVFGFGVTLWAFCARTWQDGFDDEADAPCLAKLQMFIGGLTDPVVLRRPCPAAVARLWRGLWDSALTSGQYLQSLLVAQEQELRASADAMGRTVACAPRIPLLGTQLLDDGDGDGDSHGDFEFAPPRSFGSSPTVPFMHSGN